MKEWVHPWAVGKHLVLKIVDGQRSVHVCEVQAYEGVRWVQCKEDLDRVMQGRCATILPTSELRTACGSNNFLLEHFGPAFDCTPPSR